MSDALQPATDHTDEEFSPDTTVVTRSLAGAQLAILLIALGFVLAAVIGIVGFLAVAGVREFIG